MGVAHHITQRGVYHQRVFFTDGDRRTYLGWVTTYPAEARARILAYCLMDNHIHLVAIPEEPRSLATAAPRTRPILAVPEHPKETHWAPLAKPVLFLPPRRSAPLDRSPLR